MSEREKYMKRLWDSCDCNEGVLHYTIMDIAWSLRNIAESLIEMNGYVDPHEYMEGYVDPHEYIEGADDEHDK